MERMAGDAFIANQVSTDGATRDARGALKFNKNTKRSRETEREYEMTFGAGIIDQDDGKVKKKKKEVTKLGEEFRSKVSPYISVLSPRVSSLPTCPCHSTFHLFIYPILSSLLCRKWKFRLTLMCREEKEM